MLADLASFLAPREEKVQFAGHTVIVRELQAASDVAFMADAKDLEAKLIVRCVFNEDGAPLFSDDDIQALRAASKTRLSRLLEAVIRVNGLDVEAEAKNSEAAQG